MDETQESAIVDFLQILDEHRKNCVQQGKYVEAEVAKRRFEELKSHEVNRRLESMKAQQLKERLGLEEAHMLEFRQFNSLWDKKSEDYEDQCENKIKSMKDRHLNELKEFQHKMLEKQQKPKFSTVLLNYRKIEERLARSKNYGDAHKVKAKADRMEAMEIEQWNERKQKEMFQQESQFKAAKRQELSALQKRLKTGRESHKKQRQLALETLVQRYQNFKNELEGSQSLERINAEKHGLRGNIASLSIVDRKSNRRTVAADLTSSNC